MSDPVPFPKHQPAMTIDQVKALQRLIGNGFVDTMMRAHAQFPEVTKAWMVIPVVILRRPNAAEDDFQSFTCPIIPRDIGEGDPGALGVLLGQLSDSIRRVAYEAGIGPKLDLVLLEQVNQGDPGGDGTTVVKQRRVDGRIEEVTP